MDADKAGGEYLQGMEKDLEDSESVLEFVLISLAHALGMKPKQAAGLLSNNHKYLV